MQTASTSHVIGKSLSLVAGKKVEKRFRQPDRQKVLPSLVNAWKEKQDRLSEEGLSSKEAQNRTVDQRRNADLVKLKQLGGPFSSSEEVRLFASSSIDEDKKVARLYLEVRYARDSCVSFPKNSDIFRLKKGYKNLDSKSYAENLMVFLDKVSFRNSVEMSDFCVALDKMQVM